MAIKKDYNVNLIALEIFSLFDVSITNPIMELPVVGRVTRNELVVSS